MTEEEEQQFNAEEFKLRVKVVRAVNLTPIEPKGEFISFFCLMLLFFSLHWALSDRSHSRHGIMLLPSEL